MKTFLLFLILSLIAVITSAQNAPQPLSNPDPVYPREAGELGYGSTVKVAIKVDKKGEVKVLQAFGPNAPCANLDDGRIKKIRKAVTDAASHVTFVPFVKDGKPSEFEMTISYSFDAAGKPARTNDITGAKGRIVDAGILQGRVKFLARPDYPPSARANRLSGAIPISVLVDVDGKVIGASALGGHPNLRDSAVDAACRSTFEPIQLSGVPIQVTGVITFTFVA
ncbi:MAG: TonB family protein [Pyrinomonadaceae bacterium]